MQKLSFFLLTMLTGAAVLTGCKKDNHDTTTPAKTLGFLPNEGNYHYTFTSTDGTNGSAQLLVSPRRDSAGGQAATVWATIDAYHDTGTVFANASQTVTPITAIKEFDSLADVVRRQPGIISFTYEGWPVYQNMPNTAAVGNDLSFTGGPVHMHWVGSSGRETITGDFKLTYLSGKVIASGVAITTPAGTYNCSAWAYSKRTEIQAGPVSQVQMSADTVWMSPGVPFVKSTESINGVYTVTLLDKIN